MIPGDYLRAARKYGPELDSVAQQYRDPLTGQRLSGTAMLVKTLHPESGFDPTQNRQTAIEKFGIDPRRSVDEAVRATVLHLQGELGPPVGGFEGLFPGGGSDHAAHVLSLGLRGSDA